MQSWKHTVSSHWPALNVISGWMDMVGGVLFVMANDACGVKLPGRLQSSSLRQRRWAELPKAGVRRSFRINVLAKEALGSPTTLANIVATRTNCLTSRVIRRQPQFEMAANKEEQKPQKASKYYPAEDVSVPKKVCSPPRQNTPMHQEEEDECGKECMSAAHNGSDDA